MHPVYGPAACIVAKKPISKGEELYVSYNYHLKGAPDWYKEAFKLYKKEMIQQGQEKVIEDMEKEGEEVMEEEEEGEEEDEEEEQEEEE